jgi:hypothetical protein
MIGIGTAILIGVLGPAYFPYPINFVVIGIASFALLALAIIYFRTPQKPEVSATPRTFPGSWSQSAEVYTVIGETTSKSGVFAKLTGTGVVIEMLGSRIDIPWGLGLNIRATNTHGPIVRIHFQFSKDGKASFSSPEEFTIAEGETAGPYSFQSLGAQGEQSTIRISYSGANRRKHTKVAFDFQNVELSPIADAAGI